MDVHGPKLARSAGAEPGVGQLGEVRFTALRVRREELCVLTVIKTA